ncbi:ATP-binding cassette domain-containing protein [Rhodoferax antarcticus]|uniref:ATP-binding cassette domain-containing protein n=1 Tax=Rhodoferax antarcticus TaxID=81479 RepID=UPI0009FB5E0B|nr:ATP-binding cassette domain-containing protein [Rhodoferax antarcticus]
MSAQYILETRGLTKEFKGFVAVNQVDLKVNRGHIHALIGPNGAGKTTFFNLLTKFLTPSKGSIEFNGVEDGYFFLDQCRDIRNNFSAAHLDVGKLDDHEFIGFSNRCAKYALGDEHNLIGVNLCAFMVAIKGGKFSSEQKDQWVHRIGKTHEAQQYLIFGSLHGIYRDPANSEEARVNSLSVATEFAPHFTPRARSDLINRHRDYIAKGDEKRRKASKQFFEKLGMQTSLGEHEVHSLLFNACKRPMAVHQSFDNFYNEPPFAERLLQLSGQVATPDTVKDELVETVVTCATGNQFGASNAALAYLHKMIKSFSPNEVEIMLTQPTKKGILGERLKASSACRTRYKRLVQLIDVSTVPAKSAAAYSH